MASEFGNAKIAVLIPCWNEGRTVGKVVRDMKFALPSADIYVYDNNSTDDTASEALKAGAIVKREPVQGKGAVVRRMFREIDADVYVMADGDDTYPADAAPELVRAVLSQNADMVVGDRLSTTYFTENKRLFHSFGNNIVRWAVNLLFKSDIRDVMTGYRAFSFQFVKTFPVLSRGFQIETEMTIHAADRRMHVVNMPIEFRDRPEGSESKLNTIPDGIRVMWAIAALFRRCRPMAFFGILSGLLVSLAGGFFVPVLLDFARTGIVEKFPTLIVSGFSALAGLLSLACGLVLNDLRDRDRRDFEFRLQEVQSWRRK